MKQIIILIFTFLSATTLCAQDKKLLSEFSPSNFEGWEYDRPNFILSEDNIIQYKVTLFAPSSTRQYVLKSPLIEVSPATIIIVEFDWKASNYDQSSYNTVKGSPLAELISEDGNLLISKSYTIPEATLYQTIKMTLTVPQATTATKCYLRLSAPKADVNCTGAVKTVMIYDEDGSTVSNPIHNIPTVKTEQGEIVIENATQVQIIHAATGQIEHQSVSSLTTTIRIKPRNKGVYIIKIGDITTKVLF